MGSLQAADEMDEPEDWSKARWVLNQSLQLVYAAKLVSISAALSVWIANLTHACIHYGISKQAEREQKALPSCHYMSQMPCPKLPYTIQLTMRPISLRPP